MADSRDSSATEPIAMPQNFEFESSLADDSDAEVDQPMEDAAASEAGVPHASDGDRGQEQEALASEPVTVDTIEPVNTEAPDAPSKLRLELVFRPLSVEERAQYVAIPPAADQVSEVLERISSTPGESWWKVQFEDGNIDQVTLDDLVSLPNGRAAFKQFKQDMDFDQGDEDANKASGNRPRKRKAGGDPDYSTSGVEEEEDIIADDMDDGDDDVLSRSRTRRLRQSAPMSSRLRNMRSNSQNLSADRDVDGGPARELRGQGSKRVLRARKPTVSQATSSLDDDADELAHDTPAAAKSSDDDGDFFLVTSDIRPSGKRKRRKQSGRFKPMTSRSRRDSSIEFEAPRKSGRSTRNLKNMTELTMDEELYAEDDKPAGAPRVINMREIFQPVSDGDFKEAHAQQCDTCGLVGSSSKGPLIYCQGCSYAYHKVCLGYRSARDHAVTKIGPDSFVLQCRYCVGAPKKKDPKAPNHAMCQACKVEGQACSAFAPRKTAKQEEKLRAENDGVDPINPVSPVLVNNASNVLFRCNACCRAYHFEHLPAVGEPNGDIVSDNIREERFAHYSRDWKCKDCAQMKHRVQTLVAWRPAERDKYTPGATTLEIAEDAKEYLAKWDTLSYAHCTWKPGSWIYGVTNATMRGAFPKRNEGENLLPKWTEKEAIPEEYLLADVILAVRYKGHVRHLSKEKDLENVSRIDKANVKFQGLGYDEVIWDEPPSEDSGPLWEAFQSAYVEYLNGIHFKSEPASRIKERLEEFRSQNFARFEFQEGQQPASLRRGKLMDYQREGLNWLMYNFHQESNVVLADEMGLGKTIQVIALLATLVFEKPKCWPFLVVVPNSTCPNWRREIKKWVPDLRVVTYHGGKAPQQLAYDYELFPNGSKEMRAHVVVMSYDSAQDDHTRALFKNVRWTGLVVDEGQRLKNDQNLLYGALRAMRIPFRLLLTGTPLQNNKRELFNLIQFIDSSKNAARLDEEYEEITSENLPKLHSLIKPYFLRRTKAEVLHFLPPMAQIIVPVSMSVVQEKLCKSIMAKNPELIRAIFANSKMKANERGSLNNILMQLRKCLCHPFMYSGAIEDKSADPQKMFRNLIEASSKLVLLEIMLPKLKERGHRVLIFSQFLDQLDIIEDFLTGLGYDYGRLDGKISSLEKQKRIDVFNEPDSKLFAFLLSTRAGGVGINLATADTVIILDPDFNPHQDIQALSRAHRIGQKNKVLCFQLMTKNSVEEKIMQIGRKKMALDHALIERMDAEDEVGNDLESILKHGAEALFNEDHQKDVVKYDSASVDRLLDRSQMENTQVGEDRSAESQFSFARVWANDKGTLTDDIDINEVDRETMDSNVWEKILKEREEEARRLAELDKEVLGRGGRRRHVVHYNTKVNYDLEDGEGRRDSDSDRDADFVNNGAESDEESDGALEGVVPEPGLNGAGMPGSTNSGKGQEKKSRGAEVRKQPEKVQGQPPKTVTPIPPPMVPPQASGPAKPARPANTPKPAARQNIDPVTGKPRRGRPPKFEINVPVVRSPQSAPPTQRLQQAPSVRPQLGPPQQGQPFQLNPANGAYNATPVYPPVPPQQNNFAEPSRTSGGRSTARPAANGVQEPSAGMLWEAILGGGPQGPRQAQPAQMQPPRALPMQSMLLPLSPAQEALLAQARTQAQARAQILGPAQTQAQRQSGALQSPGNCPRCRLNHTAAEQCPVTMTEVQIRVALDKLERSASSVEERQVRRDWYKRRLREMRGQRGQAQQ